MRKKLPYILILWAFALSWSCKNEIRDAMEAETNLELPTQVIYQGKISYSTGGKITSRLFSPEIKRYYTKDSSYVLMNKGFRAVFYDSLGNFESEMTARKGTWFESRKIMIGEKDVIFKNVKGETLNTEKLIWYQDSARIFTDMAIKITKPDGVIFGRGLSASEDFSSYIIPQITGELYVEEKELTSKEDSLP